MKNPKFYRCNGCKTILLAMGGSAPQCCDKELELLTVNTTDGATEKHIPVCQFDGCKLHVKIGSVAHPMIAAHYIMWIYVQTKTGGMFKYLTPEDVPEADFTVEQSDVLGVYEYCNLHELWTANIVDFEDLADLEVNETTCPAEFSKDCIG